MGHPSSNSMNLPSQVKFVDAELQKDCLKLQNGTSSERQLSQWLTRAFTDISENAFCGIQIPKRLIPKAYLKKYGIHNLWKYNLPAAWRLLYAIENQEIIVVSIVLEWLSHTDYERRFQY